MTLSRLTLRSLLPLLLAGTGLFIYSHTTLGCCGDTPDPPLNGFGEPGTHTTELIPMTNQCLIIQPTNDSASYPVVLWAGGPTSTATSYQQGLEHIASYGFVVGNIGSSMGGVSGGESLLGCLDAIMTNPRVRADLSQVAVAGHSAAGSAAVFAGTDSRVSTTLAIQPLLIPGIDHDEAWNSQQQGPVLLLLGENDTMSRPDLIEPFFYQVNTPIFSALEAHANHFEPLGDFGEFAPVITGWLRYQLYDDNLAAELFVLPWRWVCDEPNFSCEVKGTFE